MRTRATGMNSTNSSGLIRNDKREEEGRGKDNLDKYPDLKFLIRMKNEQY